MEQLQPTARTRSSFIRRVIGAAAFSIPVYEEVEHDRAATAQAGGLVGLVAVAAAVGGYRGGVGALFAAVLSAYLGWALWSGTCYLVGTQLFEGTADWGELLRTIGFAQAPGILYVLGALGGLGAMVQVAVYIWLIGTVLVAIRQALDFGTGRALATALAGFVPYVLVKNVVELVLHQAFPGVKPVLIP